MFFKRYKTDIWNVGIVKAKASDFLKNMPSKSDVVWLPIGRSFTFCADPFGIWRDGKLYVFVEAFDYRVGKGTIECFVLNKKLELLDHFPAIEEPYHLSYPFVIEDKGGVFFIPESSKKSETWIYEATDFPKKWKKYKVVLPGVRLVDASFLKYKNVWWMFYSVAGKKKLARRELNVAMAKSLSGPWSFHPQNPVQNNIKYGRPGGKPFIYKDVPYVPVQNCQGGYGKKVELLRVVLTKTKFAATHVKTIDPVFHKDFTAGLHHFAECGDVTLIDSKIIDSSWNFFFIKLQRKIRRLYSAVKEAFTY